MKFKENPEEPSQTISPDEAGKKQRVLILDQEDPFRQLLTNELINRQLEVITSGNIEKLYDLVLRERPDLMLVNFDRFMLDKSIERARKIIDQCKRIRLRDHQIWLLVINSKPSLSEKIKLLKEGFDEVLQRPVSTDELFIRIEKMLRRSANSRQEGILTYGHLKMDLFNRKVWSASKEVDLRVKEFDLLKVFMLSPEKVLSKKQIFDQVWDSNFIGDSNVIEVYIKYLRTKIGSQKPVDSIIKTERGQGYIMISEKAMINRSNEDIELD